MENTANHIVLRGTLVGLPEFSHENHERNFYRFALEVSRLSGAMDVLQIVVAEDVLHSADLFGGCMVEVTGQVRLFNSRNQAGRKLVISVYAETMTTCDGEPVNEVSLRGTICKPPIYRRTPLGREICDIMLAVNRQYHRTDYLPCILWGKTAQEAAAMSVGTQIQLEGRLQSRDYIKVLDGKSECRTAYEISAISAQTAAPEEPDPDLF